MSDISNPHRLRWLSPYGTPSHSLDNGSKNDDGGKGGQSAVRIPLDALETILDTLDGKSSSALDDSVLSSDELERLKAGIIAAVENEGMSRLTDYFSGSLLGLFSDTEENKLLDVWALVEKYPAIAGSVMLEILLARPRKSHDPSVYRDIKRVYRD